MIGEPHDYAVLLAENTAGQMTPLPDDVAGPTRNGGARVTRARTRRSHLDLPFVHVTSHSSGLVLLAWGRSCPYPAHVARAEDGYPASQ